MEPKGVRASIVDSADEDNRPSTLADRTSVIADETMDMINALN